MDDLRLLESKLGVTFVNYSLLSRALTHRSFLNENSGVTSEDNERLEFLGDAVLDFVVGAFLYHRFPEIDEGGLTILRSALVRAETLADFAKKLELGAFVRMGYGESESGGRERVPALSAAFEAVVGALYLDQGLGPVEKLLEQLVEPALIHIMAASLHKDPKSEFQIWAQAAFNETPYYQVVDTAGPDHARTFTLEVVVGEAVWGTGVGRSKQAAARAAAAAALIKAEAMEDDLDITVRPEASA